MPKNKKDEIKEKSGESKKGSSKKKVLIIEDDTMISGMYKMKLEDHGFIALTASDGNEGLLLAKKEKPDLILLDIMMPMVDGFSVLAEIKAAPGMKDTPVIIMTNLGTTEDIEKGKKMGASDYVVKADLTPAQIVEKVEKYIR
ncbi:MAG: response regulator [Patescibacteria group bacterium]|jgi:DNA-binding response OmpR family regulator